MSAPKKTVSFPPPPTNSVLGQIPSEDGTVQEDPEGRDSTVQEDTGRRDGTVQEDTERRKNHHSFLSTASGQIFDSFTKLYVLLCFSIFVDAMRRFVEMEEIKDPKMILIVGSVGLAINLVGAWKEVVSEH